MATVDDTHIDHDVQELHVAVDLKKYDLDIVESVLSAAPVEAQVIQNLTSFFKKSMSI